MIVAMRVVRGQSQPHQFVFFITYLAQLYGPLNMLGYLYRTINQSLVDTERLLKLLSEPTEINDRPNAPDLIVENGEIEFGKSQLQPLKGVMGYLPGRRRQRQLLV